MDIDVEHLQWQLPAKSLFPAQMPRYPNVWFFVDTKLALRAKYAYAVQLVASILEDKLGMLDTLGPKVQNHNLYHLLNTPGEGADFEYRIGPIHYQEIERQYELSHYHQLHGRFYVTSLPEHDAHVIDLGPRPRTVQAFALPGCVHYEVVTEDQNHPYVDCCPLCGITGEYDVPIDRSTQDYCVKIHDPLGVEYLLYGTIRGSTHIEGADSQTRCIRNLRLDGINCSYHDTTIEGLEPKRMALIALTAET